MTYYDILGVPNHATQEQIKQAYRMQVRFFHPDLFDGPPDVADIKTKQLNEAYSVLGNPELRSQYDRIIKMHTQEPPKPHPDNQAYAYTAPKPPPRYTPYSNDTGKTRAAEEEKRRKREERKKRRESRLFATIIVLLLVLIGFLVYYLWNMDQEPVTQTQQQPAAHTSAESILDRLLDAQPKPSYEGLGEPEPETPATVAKPKSGTILYGEVFRDQSEITVTADSSSDYVVTLKSVHGVNRVTFFVRAGETATVGVPCDYLYVYFACGDTWYGYGEGRMFGEDTVYSKDDEIMDFTQYTWEYTLYPVTDGNFSETPSSADEFFQ